MKFISSFTLLFALISSQASSLPIGFGIPQGERKYHQTTDTDFLIYHDSKTPHEALMILDSLQTVKPILDKWFFITRTKPLPIISSALTSNASFANFITDAIELQTLGQGHRDLFWHEYVHNIMFLHLKNFMGPAGSIFHIPWMPAWFLEGLAEALSVSTGSERQATIERKQARLKSWPSYNRLHSLYSNSSFFEQGYSSSGAFVSWLLKKGYAIEANFLPLLLKRFYKYTLPQYYPATATPISDFLPMDEALRDFFQKNGRQLYAEYKHDAETFWSKNKKTVLIQTENIQRESYFKTFPHFKTYGESVFLIKNNYPNPYVEKKLIFDTKSGNIKEKKDTGRSISKENFDFSLHGSHSVAISTRPSLKNGVPIYQIVLLKKENNIFTRQTLLLERKGQISHLAESQDKIYWKETVYEVTRLCFLEKENIDHVDQKSVICPVSATLPKSLNILGSQNSKIKNQYFDKQLWYSIEEQTIKNTRYELWNWDLDKRFKKLNWDTNAFPIELAKTSTDDLWVLVSERTNRSLLKTNLNGDCLGMVTLDDDVSSISAVANDLLLVFSMNKNFAVKRFHSHDFKLEPCRKITSHISPLTYAVDKTDVDLKKALEASSLWSQNSENSDITVPLGSKVKEIRSQNKSAEWRPRPILALPWIGANDALGYQLGAISIPLMDHMQNETLYLSVLYGVASHYPNTEMTLFSTRFWPQLSFSVYRRQLWNGSFELNTGERVYSYLDDKGGRIAASINLFSSPMTTTLTAGFLASYREPYSGPTTIASKGRLLQPFTSIAFLGRLERWNWTLRINHQIAPSTLNTNFDYNSTDANVDIYRPLNFLDSTLGFGLEGGRTRGKTGKTPVVRQIYLPVKTFIPGTGSTYNQNSYPFMGNGKLLQAQLGDNKAKAEINWHFPMIKDWDKLIWILYFYELRFSSFLNYGGAWYQGESIKSRMLLSHGYSVDMLFENKGVKFNMGIGVGQASPGPGQIFINLGFNLFF